MGNLGRLTQFGSRYPLPASRASLTIPASMCSVVFLPVCAVFYSYQCVQCCIPTSVCSVLFLPVCAVFSLVQSEVWLSVLGIVNVPADVNECNGTWGPAERAPDQSVHRKLTLGENPYAEPGNRTRVSVAAGFLVRNSTQ